MFKVVDRGAFLHFGHTVYLTRVSLMLASFFNWYMEEGNSAARMAI